MSNSRYYQVANSAIGRGDYQKPELKTPSPVYIDSGFSDTFFSMPMQVEADSATYTGAPPPPQLIVGRGPCSSAVLDAENGDSGITADMSEDDTEKDCGVTFKGQTRTRATPMEVDVNEGLKSLRSSTISPPVPSHSTAKKFPRLAKRMLPGSSSTSIVSSGVMRTAAPHRASSPKTVYSQSHTTPHTSFFNKENLQGPYSLPAPRSNSPLTCNMNNFHSMGAVDRVPPVIDLYRLQDHMYLFLPDGKDGDTGFHLSVIHNQPDVLDKLLFIMSKEKKLRPVLDEQNRLYQTALHLATHLQQIETMRKLLIAGASVNITDHKGNTPLHIAAKLSSTRPLEEIVRYTSIQTILEVSQVRNNEGLSCVHIAAKNGNMEILSRLRSLGVNMNMQDFNSGKTALHLSVENSSLANVQFLLETCEVDVNSLMYSGCSPLHIASGRGDISIVAYLVSMGADPELCTDEGDIALDLAGSEQVQSFLTKAAALHWLY